MSDQQDLQVVSGEPPSLMVHLGDQRTRRINSLESALLSLSVDYWRHAVCREHHRRAFWYLIELRDENGAPLLQVFHYVPVVDDLLPHVNRGPVGLQRLLDSDHGAIHTRAIAARCGQHNLLGAAHDSRPATLSHPVSVGAAAVRFGRPTSGRPRYY